eukprot:scaffold1426_cov83-Cylindrotheca_fusiformis.AAC.4
MMIGSIMSESSAPMEETESLTPAAAAAAALTMTRRSSSTNIRYSDGGGRGGRHAWMVAALIVATVILLLIICVQQAAPSSLTAVKTQGPTGGVSGGWCKNVKEGFRFSELGDEWNDPSIVATTSCVCNEDGNEPMVNSQGPNPEWDDWRFSTQEEVDAAFKVERRMICIILN